MRRASLAHPCYPPPALGRLVGRCFCECTQRLRLHAFGPSDFDAWVAENPLPGRQLQPRNGGDEGSAAAAVTATTGTARRFGWAESPAISATFIARHSQCTWIRQSPGLLAAHEGTASEAPVANLALPRLLAGTTCCAGLWADSSAAAASPLSVRPEAEEQQLRQALAALAALDGGGGNTSSSREPLSIGSQLLVLLSADSAALAIYSEGQLLRHKVHTGYTVRRQQGKAQATYERQGGGEAGWAGRVERHSMVSCRLSGRASSLLHSALHDLRIMADARGTNTAHLPHHDAAQPSQAREAWAAPSVHVKLDACSRRLPPPLLAGRATLRAAPCCSAADQVKHLLVAGRAACL